MKLHHDSETDSLYIELSDRPGVEAEEIRDGVVVDFDAEGNVVGLDIEHASRRVSLEKLEADSLPVVAGGA